MADRKEQGQDDRQELDRALERRNEDLAGDIETNRNLSGSTTYETLSEEGDLDVASGNSDSGSDRDRGSRDARDRGRDDSSGGGMR